jgi:iron complex outermembrane receptor protein
VIGNAATPKEESNGLELAFSAKAGRHDARVSVFENRYRNFITVVNTGNTRGADGALNPVDLNGDGIADASGQEILPELQYRAVPARFLGLEAQDRIHLLTQGAGTLDLILRYDALRGDDLSTGLPLPRIAPQRYGAMLDYGYNAFHARLETTRVAAQDRVAPNELPTAGYTMVNAMLSYRMKLPRGSVNWFLRGSNLLNQDARNHVSFLKDIAPLGGRAVQVGLQAQF